MTEAAHMAASITSPTWIMAHQQTDGRGRRGRAWLTPKGNLTATLVFEPHCTPAQAAQRSFLAANALYNALAIYVPSEKLSLKWPNDVLLNGGKVAGILLESLVVQGQMWGVAVGIGVNLIAAPDMTQVEDGAVYPVSVKVESGVDVTPDGFLKHLAPAFAQWDLQLTTYGFAPIRTAWLARAARLGETITARLPNENVTGRFDTVDENGYLVLNTAKGPRNIAAADVFF
jgi:BirA family biotin operon repressor/biotin-[acetyl-CoA-carboxylase] ligase